MGSPGTSRTLMSRIVTSSRNGVTWPTWRLDVGDSEMLDGFEWCFHTSPCQIHERSTNGSTPKYPPKKNVTVAIQGLGFLSDRHFSRKSWNYQTCTTKTTFRVLGRARSESRSSHRYFVVMYKIYIVLQGCRAYATKDPEKCQWTCVKLT